MTDELPRFAFGYGHLRPLMSVMGTVPRWSGVKVGRIELAIRMGWAFRARIARSAIQAAGPHEQVRGTIGVHGRQGRWLINGSSKGIVSWTSTRPPEAP